MKTKTRYKHMTNPEVDLPRQNIERVGEQLLTSMAIDRFIVKPTVTCLKASVGYTRQNGWTSVQWPMMMSRYPDLPWKTEFDLALTQASWRLLPSATQRIIVAKWEAQNIKSDINPILYSCEIFNIADEETIKLGYQIYRTLKGSERKPELGSNKDNNQLLANTSLQAATSKKLDFWRFVCLPKLTMSTNMSGCNFVDWEISFDDNRYDTLTQPLPFDKNVISQMTALGIDVTLYYVVDEWEALWLRAVNQYEGLSPIEQQKAQAKLAEVRSASKKWILDNSSNSGLSNQRVLFFNQLINYQSFIDLLDALQLEQDTEYRGLFNAEMDFIRKAGDIANQFDAEKQARLRILQYALEGVVISDSFLGQGIYLAGEYPIQSVWKKLTLLTPLPTLFYAKDEDVKNI